MSKKKENTENVENVVVETVVAEAAPVVMPKLGRPVSPGSVRQQILKERELRKQEGTFKLGRPMVEGSKRQLELAAKAEKIANGYVPKKGRPTVPGCKRQLALEAKALRATAATVAAAKVAAPTVEVTE